MMFSELKGDAYRIVNLILAGIILLIFVYSAIWSPSKADHPIPSESEIFWKQESKSTGLSRSFSSIVRLNFNDAGNYNQYGLQLFTFFLIQLFLRLFFLFSYNKYEDLGQKNIVIIDSVISGGLFILFFMPFLSDLI